MEVHEYDNNSPQEIVVNSVTFKWSVSDDTVTLEEFLESIESRGSIGRWTKNDQREVAILKLGSQQSSA